MTAKIIDGKLISEQIRKEIAVEIAEMIDNDIKVPHLVAVLVGEDGASKTYIEGKEKASRSCGMTSSIYRYEENISEQALLDIVDFLNEDEEVDGFIVQLPLPKHINVNNIIERIKPSKDVDGFHPINLGRMAINLPSYVSATPAGIVELIKRSGIETEGKHCVVIGRSNIVGTPVSLLLSRNTNPGNCTVTLCHSRSKNLKDICLLADILIVAIGKPEFLTADMVKPGAVVIDVGIHRVPFDNDKGYKIVGDVKYNEVAEKCSFITPVPGGVGPMTITSLLINTLKAAKKEIYL